MAVCHFEALKTWAAIPKCRQEKLLDTVFCSACGITTAVDYTLQIEEFGVILKGKCKHCGGRVARFIENF